MLLTLFRAALEHDRQMERERAEREMELARQAQLRLLPSEAPVIPGVAAGFAYKAALSGRYDFIR